MNPGRFDALTREFARSSTRRQLLKAAAALAPARVLAFFPASQASQCGATRFCTDPSFPEHDSSCCCCGPGCDPLCSFFPVPSSCPICPGLQCPGTTSCADGESLCCCSDVGDCCKDLQNDPNHCGSCNAAPCAGACSGGQCFCADASKTYCPDDGCVDLQNDVNHCGACDAPPCRGVCIGGECTCKGSKVLCAEGCVDLTSDSQHCGQCGAACADSETCLESTCCPDGHGVCWGECIDLREDRRHCGACGHACTSLQPCVDGVCVQSDPPTDGCSAQSLRLWINAFYPGVVDGITRQRLIDGKLASVYLPLPQQRVVTRATEPPCSNQQTCLRTDRRPDPQLQQAWTTFFSRDPSAPSLAHAEIEIDLRDRQAIREVVPQPEATYGALLHVEDLPGAPDGVIPSAVERCRRPIFGDAQWFRGFDPDAIAGGIRFRVGATWNAWDEIECTESGGAAGDCVMDQFAVCPLGSILGTISVQVRPEEGVVRVSIPELEVPRYPVIEIYAALDDGHVVPIWVSEDAPVPLGQLGDVLPDLISDISVDIPCGCGPCDAGETSCEEDEACISDSYFILSSSQELRLNEEVLGLAPDAGIDSAGPVTVTLNGVRRIFQGRDGGDETRTPPIGFRGKKGNRLKIEIACPDGAATCPGALAGPLFLHRIDSLFGERPIQQLIAGRVPLPLADVHQRQVIELSRVTKPGGICLALDEDLAQICLDVLSDPTQCGGLGDPEEFACGETEICLNGVCRCPIHMTRVAPRQCADLLNDDAHCGEPENACAEGSRCVMGTCRS